MDDREELRRSIGAENMRNVKRRRRRPKTRRHRRRAPAQISTGMAPLHPTSSAEGRRVLSCEACQKVAYATVERATAAAEKVSTAGQTMYTYLGRECGWWHLTRSAPRAPGVPR